MLLNEQLMLEVGNKILKEAVTEADLDAVFQAFESICASDDILLFTLKDYTESFQFVFDEYSYGIAFEKGVCKTVKGTIQFPDVTYRIHKEVALDIINGRVYSAVAHMNGDVDYIGYKDGAIRFIAILENALDGITGIAKEKGAS